MHRPPPPRAAPRRLLAALCGLVLLVTHAAAQVEAPVPDAAVAVGRVDAWPLWVEAGRGSAVSVLAADGALWFVGGTEPAPDAVRLARGLAGEQATACGAALLVVDERGALRRVPRAPDLPVVSVIGPQVSRYHKPLCWDGGAVVAVDPGGAVVLLSRELEPRARAELAALPDAELVLVALPGDLSAVAVLSDPTQRYRHGALGDEVEAAAVTLLRLPDLAPLATWRPAAPAVIEDRRVVPWSEDGEAGLYLTVSDEASGARLVRLVWDGEDLRARASGAALGASQRWLHLFGAAGSVAYATHEPREGGPLVRYRAEDAAAAPHRDDALGLELPTLAARPFDLGLLSHVDGERLLDRALLVGRLDDGADLLLVPRHDQRTLAWLRCDEDACETIATVRLPATLTTNLALASLDGVAEAVVQADRTRGVWRQPLPVALAGGATTDAPSGR